MSLQSLRMLVIIRNMRGRLCFDKKIGLFFLFLFVGLFFVILFSRVLTTQKTSYKSRASDSMSPQLIYGGTEVVDSKKWPFTVRLFLLGAPLGNGPTLTQVEPFKMGYCGGTLIASRWILTAGHCVGEGYMQYDSKSIGIFIGSNDLKTPLIKGTNYFEVKKIYRHENYTSVYYPKDKPGAISQHAHHINDIALLELYEDVHFPTISLSDDLIFEKEKTRSVYVGWGYLKGNSESSIMRQAVVPVLSNKRVNRKDWYDGMVYEANEFAAGYPLGLTGTCGGDSGGPLLSWNKVKKKWIQTGVISWTGQDKSETCALPKQPGVNVRISQYLDWIRETTFIQDLGNGLFNGVDLTTEEAKEYDQRIIIEREIEKDNENYDNIYKRM